MLIENEEEKMKMLGIILRDIMSTLAMERIKLQAIFIERLSDVVMPNPWMKRSYWQDMAVHFCDGMEYYRGLLDKCGESIGVEAYTQDDGGIVVSVLRAKVPELVEKLKRERDEARKEVEYYKARYEQLKDQRYP